MCLHMCLDLIREFRDVVFEDVVFEDVLFDSSSSVIPYKVK